MAASKGQSMVRKLLVRACCATPLQRLAAILEFQEIFHELYSQ
jgi:hypothetical protein